MGASAMNIQERIAVVDEKLDILRESWLDAAHEKKSSWMERIDAVLDARILLMRIRDAVPL